NPGFPAQVGASLYQDGSLFHDTYFRGIEKILDWTEEQIVLSCRSPKVPAQDQGQFPVHSINTFFADIQYQGMVIWVQRYYEGAKSLPLQTNSATIYRSIPFDQEFLVHIKIVAHNEFKIIADCTVFDQQGQVYMLTEGATVTASKQLTW
ncbi:MAG: polyketide synthase dehydratase domain-containing protein, partial [Bacteroidota bacterium]